MFGKRRLERFEARQEATLDQIGHITAALIVREPGTALSANAYDGLRKQVSIAARDRRQHLARLIELHEAIDNGATTETLRRKCEQWCHEVGLEAVTDLERGQADWFRIVEGDGPEVEVLTPAWADTEVGHLVQRGTARRYMPAAPPEPVPAETAEPDEPDEPAAELTEAGTLEATTDPADTAEPESIDEAEPTDEPDEPHGAEEAGAAEPGSEVAETETTTEADATDEAVEADDAEETEPVEAAGGEPTGETEPTHESEETEETEETR